MDHVFYGDGFLYEEMTYCTFMHCQTVQFIFWWFVCALGFTAMEIDTFVLIDHQLISWSNYDFIFIFPSAELVWAPDCVTYWVAFLTMNKPYSHPEAINPSVTHEAVARSASVISTMLFDFFFLFCFSAYLFTKLKLKLMFSYLFNFMWHLSSFM